MGLRGQLWQGGRIIPKLNQKATQCNRHAWPFVAHLLRIFFLVVLKGYLADMGATTSLGVVIPVDPIGPDQSINPSIVRHAHDVVIEWRYIQRRHRLELSLCSSDQAPETIRNAVGHEVDSAFP